jgi:hypothetical protein
MVLLVAGSGLEPRKTVAYALRAGTRGRRLVNTLSLKPARHDCVDVGLDLDNRIFNDPFAKSTCLPSSEGTYTEQ